MLISMSDMIRYSWTALRGYPNRTLLMLTAMAIGVASVIMLTALGEGARRYVTNEFTSLGTNLVIVFPGYSETSGLNPIAMVGTTPRDLTLDDALVLSRNTNIRRIAPINIGSVNASFQGRSREVPIIGSNSELLNIRQWELSQGRFLPVTDLDRATPVCVIGRNIQEQLFDTQSAVGQWIRLGDRRFRVIGILASEGRSIGVDVQDTIIIPVASAQQLFNTPSLFRILVEAKTRSAIEPVKRSTIEIIKERHQGKRDVTVITQDAVLATFDRILAALTYAIGGIAAISLAVAGILIMNVMLVAVSQRTAEIGLLKALGATQSLIIRLILSEAIMLSAFGTIIGLLLGELGCLLIRQAFPDLPAYAPVWAVFTAIAISLMAGFIFSLLPARQAARLDPVLALTGK
ncbi:MAG: FtsX-like permease family protein [Gammaproteobacteria bacterium]|nr:FtsX-like permease family protein [Gammaproteobacteria bacterium]